MRRRDFLGLSAGASLVALNGRAWGVSADAAPKRLVVVLLRGAVPGANGGLVMIRKSIKTTKQQQTKAADKK